MVTLMYDCIYLCIEGITKIKQVLSSKHLFFAELLCKEKTCWDFHFGTENPLEIEVTRCSNTLGVVINARTVGRIRMPVFDSLLTKLSQVIVINNCSCSKPPPCLLYLSPLLLLLSFLLLVFSSLPLPSFLLLSRWTFLTWTMSWAKPRNRLSLSRVILWQTPYFPSLSFFCSVFLLFYTTVKVLPWAVSGRQLVKEKVSSGPLSNCKGEHH